MPHAAQIPAGQCTASAPQLGALPAAGRRSLTLGGVAFDLSWEAGARFELPAHGGEVAAQEHPQAAARLQCQIRWERASLVQPLTVEPERPGASGRARGFAGLGTRGELRQTGDGEFHAVLSATPGAHGCAAALRALAGLVIEIMGGQSLHAAAVEVGEGAILFVGPSGAGKSTACGMLAGHRCLAFDHVVVSPYPGGSLVWRVPFGRPGALPLSEVSVLPLLGVLRVQQAGPDESTPAAVSSAPARALFDLRESAEVADSDPARELSRLAALERIAATAPVGRVRTVLGQSLGAVIDAWLAESAGRGHSDG